INVSELTYILQRAKVLITNDSSPLHIAASTDPKEPDTTGLCWIGFIATCKHPDFMTHWRKGQWQFREENLSLGGMWETLQHIPNQMESVRIDVVDQELLNSWLPKPSDVAKWARKRHG